MLINCKECGGSVSSKAIACPHCGYPINHRRVQKQIMGKMKLPNGFGQISKITGRNLRKPYRAIVTIGHTDEGRPIQKLLKPQGYFATYEEAYKALEENAKTPYDRLKDCTFFELFNKWYEEKRMHIGQSRHEAYQATFKHLKPLWYIKMTEIKPINIKETIMSVEGNSTQKNMKILLNQVFDYAVENEIVEKNYARITKLNVEFSTVKNPHRAVRSEEIGIFVENINEQMSQMLLMMCYSGLRPGEFVDLKAADVNINDSYMIGGKKTKAGINRTIPIHPYVKGLFAEYLENAKRKGSEYLVLNQHNQHMSYRSFLIDFNSYCNRHNIEGLRPHDCRKYFVTQAKKYQLDEYAIKRIVGHEITDITEAVYTERSVEWLKEQISLIPNPECRNNVSNELLRTTALHN